MAGIRTECVLIGRLRGIGGRGLNLIACALAPHPFGLDIGNQAIASNGLSVISGRKQGDLVGAGGGQEGSTRPRLGSFARAARAARALARAVGAAGRKDSFSCPCLITWRILMSFR